jgi:hypothetical protein
VKIKNAKTAPRVFYGLHMTAGLAEYRESAEPQRIFIGEQTIKNMDSTFPGKPVYVHHVDEVDLANIQNEADGYVVESFFNKSDGKHWCKFIVVSDKGHEAITKGWKLSNAYIIKNVSGGGRWHGLDYDREVTQGEYEHLAIVPNPRYDESIILTPEQFKEYNEKKEVELTRLKNSKENKGMKFNFFKKEKVENTADLETMSVVLPKSGMVVELAKLINDADEAEEKKDEPVMANGDHMVEIGKEKMSVNDLCAKYENMCKAKNEEDDKKKENEEDEELKKKENQEEEEKKKENEDEEEGLENEDVEEMDDKKQNAFFEKLKNAHLSDDSVKTVETSQDQVARGAKRYGSSK